MKDGDDSLPVINLYTTVGCPKCEILRKRCKSSPIIANSDFEEFIVDTDNSEDTNLCLLIEKGMTSFPVLVVDNDFMDFDKAMKYLK